MEEVRSAMAAVSVRKTRGISVQGWVNSLLGFFQLGLGRVWVGLLEGLLNGPKDLSVDKQIRGLGLARCSLAVSLGLVFTLSPNKDAACSSP